MPGVDGEFVGRYALAFRSIACVFICGGVRLLSADVGGVFSGGGLGRWVRWCGIYRAVVACAAGGLPLWAGYFGASVDKMIVFEVLSCLATRQAARVYHVY